MSLPYLTLEMVLLIQIFVIQPERALKAEEVHLGDILDERSHYVLSFQFQT